MYHDSLCMNKSQIPHDSIVIVKPGLTRHSQLGHEIRRYIQEGVRAGELLLLVHETLADGMPLGVAIGTDDVLVAVAFEVDHVIVFFELVQLDIDEDPNTVGNVWESALLVGGGGS